MNDEAGIKRFPQVERPLLDKREYRALELPNKLKIILISDISTDTSAASLSVAAGSMSEPREFPGLAHFCEHMLFLGTEKYPVENFYSKFLAEHAGFSNAYTSLDETKYYFDVGPLHLKEALDIFAQFFLKPLFTASGVEREVNAVDSEFKSTLLDDSNRYIHAEFATIDQNHPYSRFTTGNLQTLWNRPKELNQDIRAELLKFHETFYSANLMTLSILGKESLDELESIAVEIFSGIVNKNVEIPRWEQSPYTDQVLRKILKVVPIQDVRKLKICFPIPDTRDQYKSGSISYLSELIEHEGVGSLLSLLKRKNWVTSLMAGGEFIARGFSNLEIGISLTLEGLEKINEVIEHVFEYIAMLKEVGPQKWYWEEKKNLYEILYRFRDKKEPLNLVTQISSLLIDYSPEDVLLVGGILTTFNDQLINEILNYLTPKNCRIGILSLKFKEEANLIEQWFGTQYSIEDIDNSLLTKWSECKLNKGLRLPPKNLFIPSRFDLKERDENRGIVPERILNTGLSQVWFLQDNEFELPKASVELLIHSSLPLLDPLHYLMNSLMASLIDDSLNEFSYDASSAGLMQMVIATHRGLGVSVFGFEDKLEILLEHVIERILKFNPDMEKFLIFKEIGERDLKDWKNEDPMIHAGYYLNSILTEISFSKKDLLEALNEVSFEKIVQYAAKFILNVKLTWLFYGNLTRSKSLGIATKCEKMFQDSGSFQIVPLQIRHLREIELPLGRTLFSSPHETHPCSCVVVYFQTGFKNTREIVILQLIDLIVSEPCFDQLRTKEQLGYKVFSSIKKTLGNQGFEILIESEKTTEFLENRIEAFLKLFETLLNNLTEEEFVKHKTALTVLKSEKPKTQSDREIPIWIEIMNERFNFDSQNSELKALETLELKDIQNYFHDRISQSGANRKKLSVHIVSMAKSKSAENEAEKNSEEESEVELNEEDSGGENEIKLTLDKQREDENEEKINQNIETISIQEIIESIDEWKKRQYLNPSIVKCD